MTGYQRGSMCVRAVWVALLLVGGALPLSAGDHIDLDKPEPERIFLDNPWGGSPVVSSEVGAEPQAIGGVCLNRICSVFLPMCD